ncbi:glycosyltransferase family 2 protein [Thioalkalivibrio sp. ALJ1]|uniref:glycosyltransferase family 2 protein n=1 Tax=Thioalkalivibrio sp. ALJ1 TaxID=1158144 RepID=UPI000570211D|nr:glycosyltransferase family 2 protein [Thioalkalivibrio sp. ALJ1]
MRFSLIVPYYEDPDRLDRLLRSVPVAREDIEVIVVDDCSLDQAALDALRVSWPGVRWCSTRENAGAGVARNVGLDAARGRWLVFADSDDEFLPGAFETFDGVLRPDDELVYFLAEAVQEADGSPSVRSERINAMVTAYARSPNVETLERLRLQHVNPVAKVYSRAFVESRGLRFDTVRNGEDVAFNVLAAMQAETLRAELVAVYRIYRRAGSLTTDATEKDLLARLEVLGQLNERLRDLGVKERMHAGSYIARAARFGPRAWIEAFRLMVRHEMLAATLRRTRPREVVRFLRWFWRSRRERQRLEGQTSSSVDRKL